MCPLRRVPVAAGPESCTRLHSFSLLRQSVARTLAIQQYSSDSVSARTFSLVSAFGLLSPCKSRNKRSSLPPSQGRSASLRGKGEGTWNAAGSLCRLHTGLPTTHLSKRPNGLRAANLLAREDKDRKFRSTAHVSGNKSPPLRREW